MGNNLDRERDFSEQPRPLSSSRGTETVERGADAFSKRVTQVMELPTILRGRITPITSIDLDARIEEKSLRNGHMLMVLPMNGGYHVCRVTNEAYRAYREHFETVNRTRTIKLGQSAKTVLGQVVSIKTFGSGEYEEAKEFFDEVVEKVKAA